MIKTHWAGLFAGLSSTLFCPITTTPTHQSSLSSRFCPWAEQRWCCLAARTGCPGSWPGRSGNHCPPQSRCGSLPSPSWRCCWWACSWWICVRRDLWGKKAKAWPCLAELSYNSKDQTKDPREVSHPVEMAREYLFQWKFIRVANSSWVFAPGRCKLIHSLYLWSHLNQYPHATRTEQCRLWFS